MKEQLQALWMSELVVLMRERLEAWCQSADESSMHYLRKFAKSVRERAQGIKDTEYFFMVLRPAP